MKAPLQRLTPLRDDPATGWLSASERLSVNALGWVVWAAYSLSMSFLYMFVHVLVFHFSPLVGSRRLSALIVGTISLALAPAVRRSILRMKAGRTADMLRRQAANVAADDWDALAREPEGQVASVLGWVRGRLHLNTPVGGEPVVGVAISCQSTFPGVLEAVHDFEICDEEGRTILVQMSDARTFGTPNVALQGRDLQVLFGTLEVPTGVTASAYTVHALREGDPVMVVGFKRTVIDAESASMRGAGERLAMGSVSPCPLLVFTIDAERRKVVAS